MFNTRIIISIILVNVFVYSSSLVTNRCVSQNGFGTQKFTGYWHYIASVSASPMKVRCGHMSFQQLLGNLFTGNRFSYHGSTILNLTIAARLIENVFALRFKRPDGYSPIVTMYMVTCGNENEFALELPSHDLYVMLSRTFDVSPQMMSRYRSLATDKHLTLRRMNNTACAY